MRHTEGGVRSYICCYVFPTSKSRRGCYTAAFMPDPLDPTDAIYSAFSDTIVRMFGFFTVAFGGQFVGEQIHGAPARLVALKSQGIGALLDWFEVDVLMIPAHWLFTLFSSLLWWTAPLALLIAFLFVANYRGADMFSALLILGVAQPITSFFVQQRLSPLTGMDLSFAIVLLAAFNVATVSLLLWWRRMSNELPDAEPETDEL